MIDKELFKGCSKTVVLRLLMSASMHGYEISQRLKKLSEQKLELTEGTLYPLLHSLEADGYISSSWDKTTLKRKRKIYCITTKGKALLKQRTKEWKEFLSTMEVLLPTKRIRSDG